MEDFDAIVSGIRADMPDPETFISYDGLHDLHKLMSEATYLVDKLLIASVKEGATSVPVTVVNLLSALKNNCLGLVEELDEGY